MAFVCLLGTPRDAFAQADPHSFRFNSGQTVGPFFDGWSRNTDGSFEMHFGYINRNYVEEIHVPVGPNNHFEPAAADRGQPTFFYPRIHRRVFSVTVPSGWGDERLVWTVEVRGEPEQAVGWLDAVWEIDADPLARFFAASDGAPVNQAPTLLVNASATLAMPGRLTLTATVTDDGLPEPRGRGSAPVGQERPPTLQEDPDAPKAPVNVPAVLEGSRPSRLRVGNVTLTWTVLRGPASVAVELDGEPRDGVATMTATFARPGDYVLRVQASDGPASVIQHLTVAVGGSG